MKNLYVVAILSLLCTGAAFAAPAIDQPAADVAAAAQTVVSEAPAPDAEAPLVKTVFSQDKNLARGGDDCIIACAAEWEACKHACNPNPAPPCLSACYSAFQACKLAC